MTVLALFWLGSTPAAAQDGIDVQRRLLDGGDWVYLREHVLGVPWSPAVSGAWNVGRDLAVLRSDTETRSVLPSVATGELGASFVVGPYARVGVSVPGHRGQGVEPAVGDVTVWAAFPVSNQDGQGLEGTWTVQYDSPTGRQPLLAGPGVLQGTLALGAEAGPGRWAASLGLELHQKVFLPGTVWQDAWHLGGGYRVPVGPARFGAEAVARVPARILRPRPGDLPAEGALVAGLQVHPLVLVQGAFGTGLVRGIGSPSVRAVASVDVRPRTARDRDADGVVDRVDACRHTPEDPDGFADTDGCPDLDNDEDGLPDGMDPCPSRAENVNGIDDEDGCPESAMWLSLTVTAEGTPDEVQVRLGEESWTQAVGVPVEHVVRDLPLLPLTLWADGHQAVQELFDGLGHERVAMTIHLPSAPREVTIDEGQLSLPTPVFFAVDAAEVEDPSGLLHVVAWLRDHPQRSLVVEGRADPSGADAYNQELSERRAAWVVAWLVDAGIAPDRLEASGVGEQDASGAVSDRQVRFILR